MVDFINEVEEELRKDKYNELLRRFGPFIVTLIFAIVAASGFVEYRKYSVSKKARATAASYTAAAKLAKEGENQAAIDKFIAISELAPSGYSGLALSRAAAIKVELGELDHAVKFYDRSSAAFEWPIHKDLSSLKAAYILMRQARYDEVITRAGAIAGPEAPYQDLAKEIQAHALLKTDQTKQSRTLFTYLANTPGVLSGVKSRAKQTIMLLGENKPVIVPDVDLPALPKDVDVLPKDTAPQTEPAPIVEAPIVNSTTDTP